jgi:signal transduction histidine kinase
LSAEHIEYQPVRNLRAASIAIGLLTCVFAVVASWLSFRDEHERQVADLSTVAEVGAQSVNGYFQGLQGAMQLAAGDILAADDSYDNERARKALLRLKAAIPELRIATLASLDGKIIASTEQIVPDAAATMAAQRTFIAARDERMRTGNRSLTIGRAFFGPLSREWVMPLGYGVWDSKGRLAMILGAGVPLAKPAGLWMDAPLPPGASLGLWRDDGYMLIRYPNPPGTSLEEVYGKPATGPLGKHLEASGYPARGYVAGVRRITGEESLFVYRRLASFPLTFFVADPASNTLRAWIERVWAIYVLWLVLLLTGYYVYRWVLKRQTAYEREEARQVQMLRSANQALEDFAYTIAHDLKSPVRAIDGHAGLAIEAHGAGLGDGLRHRFEQIRRNAARMGELIDDLLDFSRYSHAALAKRTIDMEALARSVAAEVVQPGTGVEVRCGELPPCEADPALMRVVWTSLISNAVKYSARSGSPRIEIGFADGQYFVRDNGVGFDMTHADKLFGVFSRLHSDDEFEGTGAGLAIARRILERHGGRISAEAAPGKGATFRFTVI